MTTPLLMADVSHWQGSHTSDDMRQAAATIGAIMLKASQGGSFVDPEFAPNAQAVNAAGGFGWGAYHFVDTTADGATQAEHFRAVASSVPGCRFYCIDWEQGSRDVATALAERLLELADVPVGDYVGSHARANGGQLSGMAFHMVPEYGVAQLNPDYATDPLSAWQYTDGKTNGTDWPSSVPGIGPCDISAVFRPQDFGFGDMASVQLDFTQVVNAKTGATVQDALKAALHLDNALSNVPADVAAVKAAVAALTTELEQDHAAVLAEIQKVETGDLTADECAKAVIELFASRMAT